MVQHSFSPALELNITDVEKFEVGKKTDQVGKKLTGYFFLPGKKWAGLILPRGKTGRGKKLTITLALDDKLTVSQ